MDIWTIVYITESGYEGEVEVSAVNNLTALKILKNRIERRPLIPLENLYEKPR